MYWCLHGCVLSPKCSDRWLGHYRGCCQPDCLYAFCPCWQSKISKQSTGWTANQPTIRICQIKSTSNQNLPDYLDRMAFTSSCSPMFAVCLGQCLCLQSVGGWDRWWVVEAVVSGCVRWWVVEGGGGWSCEVVSGWGKWCEVVSGWGGGEWLRELVAGHVRWWVVEGSGVR